MKTMYVILALMLSTVASADGVSAVYVLVSLWFDVPIHGATVTEHVTLKHLEGVYASESVCDERAKELNKVAGRFTYACLPEEVRQ